MKQRCSIIAVSHGISEVSKCSTILDLLELYILLHIFLGSNVADTMRRLASGDSLSAEAGTSAVGDSIVNGQSPTPSLNAETDDNKLELSALHNNSNDTQATHSEPTISSEPEQPTTNSVSTEAKTVDQGECGSGEEVQPVSTS